MLYHDTASRVVGNLLAFFMSASDQWDHWYDLAKWKRLRAFQLKQHPLCAFCMRKGLVVPATVVDHIESHRGDWNKFVTGKLQSLCAPCHDGAKQEIDKRGYSTEIGVDGWPTDPQHPAYKKQDFPC